MHQCTGSQVGIKGSEKDLTLLFSICKGKSQQVVSQNCSKTSVGIPLKNSFWRNQMAFEFFFYSPMLFVNSKFKN